MEAPPIFEQILRMLLDVRRASCCLHHDRTAEKRLREEALHLAQSGELQSLGGLQEHGAGNVHDLNPEISVDLFSVGDAELCQNIPHPSAALDEVRRILEVLLRDVAVPDHDLAQPFALEARAGADDQTGAEEEASLVATKLG